MHRGIDKSKLVPLLTAALQEALGRIEALEAAIGWLLINHSFHNRCLSLFHK